MVIGMDKKEAAQKLMSIFGNVDAIAVLHSVLVGISKYIIIIVFAVYTWHCFTVFIGKNMERKEEIYRRQKKIQPRLCDARQAGALHHLSQPGAPGREPHHGGGLPRLPGHPARSGHHYQQRAAVWHECAAGHQ